ncbi:CAP domain-containing protein [Mycobacterium colombiense]|uniref:CAP domain-containing protein n=1 Tax=Mycobacterium colombiense TaxID=339268 RepID=UPI003AF46115
MGPSARSRRAAGVVLLGTTVVAAPAARADNKRLNSAVVSAVYTLQHQAGCTNDVIRNNALTLAAEWHADDMINNRNINDDTDSDGSTPQDRANAAGFRGRAAETVAINPAIAISSLELVDQWYSNPDVAVYGQPDQPKR